MKLAQLRPGQRVALLECARPQATYEETSGRLTFGLPGAPAASVEAEVTALRVSGSDPVSRASITSGVRVRTTDGQEHVTHPRYCVATWEQHQAHLTAQQDARDLRFGLAQRTAVAIGCTLTLGIRQYTVDQILLTLTGFTRDELPALLEVLQPTWDASKRASKIEMVEHLEVGRQLQSWPQPNANQTYRYPGGVSDVLAAYAADVLMRPDNAASSYGYPLNWHVDVLGGPCALHTHNANLMAEAISALADHRGLSVDVDGINELTRKVVAGERDPDTCARWRTAVADRLQDPYLSDGVIGLSLRAADTWESYVPVVDVQVCERTVGTATLILGAAPRWELTHDGLLGDAGTETLVGVDGDAPTMEQWDAIMQVPREQLMARVHAAFLDQAQDPTS